MRTRQIYVLQQKTTRKKSENFLEYNIAVATRKQQGKK